MKTSFLDRGWVPLCPSPCGTKQANVKIVMGNGTPCLERKAKSEGGYFEMHTRPVGIKTTGCGAREYALADHQKYRYRLMPFAPVKAPRRIIPTRFFILYTVCLSVVLCFVLTTVSIL